MNRLNLPLLLILGAAAIGSSVLAWKEHAELAGLRLSTATDDERATMQKRAWDAEKRAQLLEAKLTALRPKTNVINVDGEISPDPANPPKNMNGAIATAMSTWASAMDDPEIQRLMTIQQKGVVNSRYAGLFKSLSLPPGKLDQFKTLLLEKQTVQNDVMIAATQQGINPIQNPGEFRQLMSNAQADIESRIKSTLGDDMYGQFQSYQQTQAQRGVINQLQQTLSYSDTPLTGSQADQLVQVLSQTGSKSADATKGSPAQPVRGGGTAITDQTIQQSEPILSPPQLAALREQQQQQQAASQLQELMRKQQQAIFGAPNTTQPVQGATPARTPGG